MSSCLGLGGGGGGRKDLGVGVDSKRVSFGDEEMF